MEKQNTLFLLDAYALIFRSYYAFIKNPRINSKGLNTSAIYGFTNTLIEILQKEKPTHIAVVFDPPSPTFRHEMFPEYKANREETPEDIRKAIPYIKEIVQGFNIPIVEVNGYEADDVIGTMAKIAARQDFVVYMMTPDKDYAQLVEEHIYMYKPARSGGGAEIMGVKEVIEKFNIKSPLQVIDILALMGDSSDNIPGAPGIGEKTAQKLITQFESVENLLNNTDQLKGKQKETLVDFKEQVELSKVLATIKLDVPLHFDEKVLELIGYNEDRLKKVFNELEFRSTSQRLFGQPTSSTSKTGAVQGDLFNAVGETVDDIYSDLKTIKDVEHNYMLVDTEDQRNALIEKLSALKAFCFDTETTGLGIYDAEIIGMSFSYKNHEAYYVPVPAEQKQAKQVIHEFKGLFENEQIEKSGQNMKFDMLMLKAYDVDVKGTLFDTLIAHYLIQPELKHNLDFLCEQYLKYKPVSIASLIGPKGKYQQNMKSVPLEELVEYAGEDADLTWQLKHILDKKLEEGGLKYLAEKVEMPLVKVLTDMELYGVKIDDHALNEYADQLREETITVEKEIIDIAGEEFNISSPKQLGDILFEKLKIDTNAKKTKTKQYSTNEETLVKLRDKHPIINKILDYRSLKKLLSTYIEALPKLIHPKTGKIHTSFNQTITATGRLSSIKPNLQNIPIREERGREIRKAFIPSDEGHVLISADYSQIELRIMAHMSQDKGLIEAFNANEDIHTATAAKIYGLSIEEVSKDQRSKAKTANFGIIYGISAFGLSQRLNISRGEAKELIDGYFASYPGVKQYMSKSIEVARIKGYVQTILGRKRYLKDINSRNAIVRGVAERNAINAPIQGSAADIIKIAMINIHRAFEAQNLQSRMILQVHDELVFDVAKPEVESVKQIVKAGMENAYKLDVPLTTEMGVGINWLEAH